ncbi:hypothetical protein [Polaribacter sp. Z022]|uniref:hypothetical protein n=1 Tax=Polaribacter sp. Z022 TaxID=2927125 RepID=UPI0020200F10|nr:hypothetical protein [Polaribacter sp. Z022]MCL7754564.1 hypothetical protein [Polaribacter sp. Z022]
MKQLVYLFLVTVLFSCGNKNNDTQNKNQVIPKLSNAVEHTRLENVNHKFEKEIENWQDLKTATSFIKKFEKVSPNEAMSNALELRDLVASLKDNEIPNTFNIPSLHARINVLHNETLRLADLTLIPAITSEEVNAQINKTIAAFSSLNSKINTILSKKNFEDAIDVDINFVGIDSTKMDSVSIKTINSRKREELLNKNKKNK